MHPSQQHCSSKPKAVTIYFPSKRLLYFGLARHNRRFLYAILMLSYIFYWDLTNSYFYGAWINGQLKSHLIHLNLFEFCLTILKVNHYSLVIPATRPIARFLSYFPEHFEHLNKNSNIRFPNILYHSHRSNTWCFYNQTKHFILNLSRNAVCKCGFLVEKLQE